MRCGDRCPGTTRALDPAADQVGGKVVPVVGGDVLSLVAILLIDRRFHEECVLVDARSPDLANHHTTKRHRLRTQTFTSDAAQRKRLYSVPTIL